MAVNREEIYNKFGPRMLEAIVRVIADEINELRTNAGLAPRTNEQILQALIDKYQIIPPFNFESE